MFTMIKHHLMIRKKLYDIIFKADTAAGKAFDIALLLVIVISIGTVMIESVQELSSKYYNILRLIEVSVTALFSIEYVIRIWVAPDRKKYIFSFFGLIDLMAILPFYLGLFFSSPSALLIIRTFRLLRVFKVLSLSRYQNEGLKIIRSLKASIPRILTFLYAIVIIIIILGTIMYLIEGQESGFNSIPKSIYWAIVTITTVGYGDIVPQTTAGKFIASLLMIIGYSIIAVPTGIITVEMTKQKAKGQEKSLPKVCQRCGSVEYDNQANFCKYCGEKLVQKNIS